MGLVWRTHGHGHELRWGRERPGAWQWKCEVDACNEHVGQGGGQPHFHGDSFGCQYTAAALATVLSSEAWRLQLAGAASPGLELRQLCVVGGVPRL